MNEKDSLLAQLGDFTGEVWADAAFDALSNPETKFAGQQREAAGCTAGDLLRIYRQRQSRVKQSGMEAIGLERVVASLAGLSFATNVQVQPFLGGGKSVTAFIVDDGHLIGCITIPWDDPRVLLKRSPAD